MCTCVLSCNLIMCHTAVKIDLCYMEQVIYKLCISVLYFKLQFFLSLLAES